MILRREQSSSLSGSFLSISPLRRKTWYLQRENKNREDFVRTGYQEDNSTASPWKHLDCLEIREGQSDLHLIVTCCLDSVGIDAFFLHIGTRL